MECKGLTRLKDYDRIRGFNPGRKKFKMQMDVTVRCLIGITAAKTQLQ